MWPSTIFVQLFNVIAQVFHLLYAGVEQAFHLLVAAISNIWPILYVWIILSLNMVPIALIAGAGIGTIAWLYSLPSPSEDMLCWSTLFNTGLFTVAFAGLAWSNHIHDAGASWRRLLLEADCVVLEAGLVVVAIAAVIKEILILVDMTRKEGLAAALSGKAKKMGEKLKEPLLLRRMGKINSESVAESDQLASEKSRKADGDSHF